MGVAFNLCCSKEQKIEGNIIRARHNREKSNLYKEPLNQMYSTDMYSNDNSTINVEIINNDKFSSQTDIVDTLSNFKIKKSDFILHNNGKPSNMYERLQVLGQGAFGIVVKVKHKTTGEYRAMKIISRDILLNNYGENEIEEEIKILKNLDHPNIIKIYEIFTDDFNFYIITEFCSEGDLYNKIEKMQYLNEIIVKIFMYQIFSAVSYLHSQNVIHGDLKLENIMIENISSHRRKTFSQSYFYDLKNLQQSQSLNENKNKNNIEDSKFPGDDVPQNISFMLPNISTFEIKLIDFGCSKIFTKDKNKFKDIIGTINYISPEVLLESFTEKCDIWSCGVIMFLLLSGDFPFEGLNEDEIIQNILKVNYNFDSPKFNKVSSNAKELISLCLNQNPRLRPSAKEIMNHPFFETVHSQSINQPHENDIDYKSILVNIKSFRIKVKFHQAVLAFLAQNCAKKDDLVKIRKFFKFMDTNGDGSISKDELISAYRYFHVSITEEEIREVIKLIDGDINGVIEYEEFIRASIDKRNLFTNENLKLAFDTFDVNKNGTISTDEIKNIIGVGKNLDDKVMRDFLGQINKKVGDEINFEEFKKIMDSLIE